MRASGPLRVRPLTATVLLVPASGEVTAPVAPLVTSATVSPDSTPASEAAAVSSVTVVLEVAPRGTAVMPVGVSTRAVMSAVKPPAGAMSR